MLAKSLFSLAIISAVVLTVQSQRTRQKIDCVQQLKTSDVCQQETLMLHKPRNFIIPMTDADVESDYCASIPNKLNCIRRYRFCLNNFARTVYDMAVKNFKTYLTRQCKDRSKLVGDFRCLDQEGRHTYMKRMGDEMTLIFELAGNQTDSDVISYTCCGYHYIFDRFKTFYTNKCAEKNQTLSGLHFYPEMVRVALGDISDLICSAKYNSLGEYFGRNQFKRASL